MIWPDADIQKHSHHDHASLEEPVMYSCQRAQHHARLYSNLQASVWLKESITWAASLASPMGIPLKGSYLTHADAISRPV